VSPQRVSRGRAHYALFLLVAVYVVNFVDRNVLTILVKPIKAELGLADWQVGVLLGPAFGFLYIFAGLPLGRLADRVARRSVIAVGLTFWSGVTALSGVAQNFWQLALARVGVAVGEASSAPSGHSLIADLYPPEKRTTAMGIYNLGASLGILVGLAGGGYLRDEVGWRSAFFIVGPPGLLLALLVRWTMTEPARGAADGRGDPGAPPTLREVVRHLVGLRTFRHLAMVAALYGMTSYAMTSWAPTFIDRVHGGSGAEVGLLLGLALGIGGAVGSVGSAWLCDRLGRRDARWQLRIPALSGLLLVPATAAFAFWPTRSGALAAFVPAALLNTVFANPLYSLTQGLASVRMRSLASAVILFVLNLVGLNVGPLLIGVLNDQLAPLHGDHAIRYSLAIVGAFNLWGAVHCLAAARTLRADLARSARA
jgi:predicted MFS family arabinose efflux permease